LRAEWFAAMSRGHRARVHALSGGGSSAAISVMRGNTCLGQSRCRNKGKHYRNANAKEAVHRFKLPVPPESRTILKPSSSATCRRKLRALSLVQQRTLGGAESASCFPRLAGRLRYALTGSAVDSRRQLARAGSLPARVETFLKGSGSSMEPEPGPEDAPKVAHAQGNLSVLPRKTRRHAREILP
jgi:hypothetical protein